MASRRPPRQPPGAGLTAQWARDEIALMRARGRRIPAVWTPLGHSVVLPARLVGLPGRFARRLDDIANTVIESGLVLALVAVVLIVGVLAVVGVQVSLFVQSLASLVIH